MPTYEYECAACGHRFEEFQSMSAKPIKKCPNCGKLKVNRLISAGAGIIFRGSGFYQTDYRSDAYKKDAGNDKPATAAKTDSTPAPAAPATSSESKPAESKAGPEKPAKSSSGGPKGKKS